MQKFNAILNAKIWATGDCFPKKGKHVWILLSTDLACGGAVASHSETGAQGRLPLLSLIEKLRKWQLTWQKYH